MNTADPVRLLLVDDDATFTTVMERSLVRQGYAVAVAHDAESAIDTARTFTPQRILLDLNLPGDSGLLALPKLLEVAPDAAVVMLTGYSSIATAVEAIKLGAVDYLCKPVKTAEILKVFAGGTGGDSSDVPDEPLSVDRLEWEHIQKVLHQNEGNITATARALGMHRRTLQRKLQKRPVAR